MIQVNVEAFAADVRDGQAERARGITFRGDLDRKLADARAEGTHVEGVRRLRLGGAEAAAADRRQLQ